MRKYECFANMVSLYPILCKYVLQGLHNTYLNSLCIILKWFIFSKNMQLLQKRWTLHAPPAHCYHSQSNGKVETTVKIAKSQTSQLGSRPGREKASDQLSCSSEAMQDTCTYIFLHKSC